MSEQSLGKGGKEQRAKCFRSDIQWLNGLDVDVEAPTHLVRVQTTSNTSQEPRATNLNINSPTGRVRVCCYSQSSCESNSPWNPRPKMWYRIGGAP